MGQVNSANPGQRARHRNLAEAEPVVPSVEPEPEAALGQPEPEGSDGWPPIDWRVEAARRDAEAARRAADAKSKRRSKAKAKTTK